MTEARPARAARDPARALRTVLTAPLLLLWSISLIQPPPPTFPGLDQSWRIGLTMATDQHLRFGRDIVFTYGPLGFVLQGTPDPALTIPRLLVTSLVVAVVAFGLWTALGGRAGFVQKLAVAVGMLMAQALMGLEYVIVLGTAAVLMRAGRVPRLAIWVGLALGTIGLFGVLSKYTIAADVLAAAGAAWLVDLVRGPRRRRRAASLAAAVAAAIVCLGTALAFGFSPPAIGAYLRTATEISAGYSAGMSLSGPTGWVVVALVVGIAVLTLAVAAWRAGVPAPAAAVAVLLFFAWKHGFVRQDGHAIDYFGSAAILTGMLGLAVRPSLRWGALAVTALVLGAFAWIPAAVYQPAPPYFAIGALTSGLEFLRHPVATVDALASASDAALAADALPAAVRDRIGSAPADVLPDETSVVAANRLTWQPVPVFQGYSAYTPALDALNRDALAEHGAAYVFFRYGTIDQRLPYGDMPATFVELFCRYRVLLPDVATAGAGHYTLLARRPANGCAAAAAGAVSAQVGDRVPVPALTSPDSFIVATFALHPTLRSRIATALWRAPEAWLDVAYDDGSVRRWRFMPATAGDGVIVSPAPRDPLEAARFESGLPVPGVRSVAMIARAGAYRLERIAFTRERRR